jgi:hypothetical protein
MTPRKFGNEPIVLTYNLCRLYKPVILVPRGSVRNPSFKAADHFI